MSLAEGQIFAGFTIVRLLGSGGMGEVYVAQHPRLPRQEALKVLRTDISADPDYRARFQREADLAATLFHPHIVGVHDRGESDAQLWIAMDYVEGTDADRLIRDRYPAGMPADEAAQIITAMASALDYAHQRGLLHRDVKPANILLSDSVGNDRRILLSDFGIARDATEISGLTTTNMTVGTVAYAAPEQLMGEQIDGRADQYALAATAYHLLTGLQLFPNSNPAVVISRHLNAAPPVLADTRPELAALGPVLAMALAKNPDDRFPRCADFARALEEQSPTRGAPAAAAPTARAQAPRRKPLSRPPNKRPPTPMSPAKPTRSRPYWLITSAVMGVFVLAGLAMFVWHPWSEDRSDSASMSSTPTPGVSFTSPSLAPAPLPPSSLSTTAAPLALPDAPPPDSGCQGVVIAHSDVEHPTLGTIRVFLFLDSSARGMESDGCILPVTRSGRVLPAISIDGQDKLGFANPATDATGNMFVTYDPGRYDGVLVLIPNADGFEDIGWDKELVGSHHMGKHAYYYAELIGPSSTDMYTIRQSHDDCTPDCASGTITSQDLHWNGSDYVP